MESDSRETVFSYSSMLVAAGPMADGHMYTP